MQRLTTTPDHAVLKSRKASVIYIAAGARLGFLQPRKPTGAPVSGIVSKLLVSYFTPERMGAFILFLIPAYILSPLVEQQPQLSFFGGVVLLALCQRLFGISFWAALWDALVLFIVVGAVLKFFGKDIFQLERFFVPLMTSLSAIWSTR